jgi:hypothetical protein
LIAGDGGSASIGFLHPILGVGLVILSLFVAFLGWRSLLFVRRRPALAPDLDGALLFSTGTGGGKLTW